MLLKELPNSPKGLKKLLNSKEAQAKIPITKWRPISLALLIELKFSLKGPDGIVKPLPIQLILLKQTIFKFFLILSMKCQIPINKIKIEVK